MKDEDGGLRSTSMVKGQVGLTPICNTTDTSIKVDGDFGSRTGSGGPIKGLRSVGVEHLVLTI